MNTRVLLIRHATTPKVGKGLTGWLPGVSLDDNGRAQAQKLVKQLEAVPLDAIYSSPLERTRETAAPLATSRGIEVIENQDLGEIHFGEWQGKDFPEIEKHSSWAAFNSYRSNVRAPGGELMLEAQARMVRGVLAIVQAHQNQNVAIFSHADVIKSFIFHLLGIPLDFHQRVEISPASISTVDFLDEFPVVRNINSQCEPCLPM